MMRNMDGGFVHAKGGGAEIRSTRQMECRFASVKAGLSKGNEIVLGQSEPSPPPEG